MSYRTFDVNAAHLLHGIHQFASALTNPLMVPSRRRDLFVYWGTEGLIEITTANRHGVADGTAIGIYAGHGVTLGLHGDEQPILPLLRRLQNDVYATIEDFKRFFLT